MKSGFTLMETLVGLAMLSLIMAGLASSLGVIGRLQRAATDSLAAGRSEQGIARDLSGLVDSGGPYLSDSDDVTGTSSAMSLRCGAKLCSARLVRNGGVETLYLTLANGATEQRRLPSGANARFRYRGDLKDLPAWPPAGGPPQTLASVVLVSAEGQALAVAPAWRRQPARCEYDLIAQACRRPAA